MEKVTFDSDLRLRVTPRLIEQVQKRAAENEQTLSEYVRQALRAHLDGIRAA